VQAADVTIAQIEAEGRRGQAVGVMHHIKNLGDVGMQTIEHVVAWSQTHRMADADWRAFVGQVPLVPTNAA
jgi:hypothetical protein